CEPRQAWARQLTRLQKKYACVVVLGVSVDDGPDLAAPLVKKMRPKFGYRVAIDDRPEDAEEGAMERTWLHAAGQDGIPTAFVVNGEGRIAWIGHPSNLDEPLAEIVAGTWHVADRAA